MSLVRSKAFGRGLATLLTLTGGCAAWGTEFVTNGSFNSSTYTVNTEFDTTFNPNNTKGNVTAWTSTGYSIYFVPRQGAVTNEQTKQSAVGQWTGSGKEMLDTKSTALSPDGGNFIGMDADPNIASTLSQSITGLTKGTLYAVSFYWAASELQSRSGATNEAVGVQVLNGATLDLNYTTGSVNTASQGFTPWTKVTLTFVASGTTETLKFLAKSTSTCLPPFVLIDGASVQAPEPATMALVGGGLALLGGIAVRRRRKQQ